jgi:hypothetical protein
MINLAESSNESYGSKMDVLPVMMMIGCINSSSCFKPMKPER